MTKTVLCPTTNKKARRIVRIVVEIHIAHSVLDHSTIPVMSKILGKLNLFVLFDYHKVPRFVMPNCIMFVRYSKEKAGDHVYYLSDRPPYTTIDIVVRRSDQ